MRWLPLIVSSILLGVVGQLSLKKGVGSIVGAGDPLAFLSGALVSPFIWLGFGAYAISSLIWLVVLSKVDLSYAYPMVALGYVLVVMASAVLLREQVSMARWLSLVVICVGVAMLART